MELGGAGSLPSIVVYPAVSDPVALWNSLFLFYEFHIFSG
jgi:hypothetical protein